MSENSLFIEDLTVTTIVKPDGGTDLQTITMEFAETSAGPITVAGFPTKGSFTVYVSATNGRQAATFFVSRASAASAGGVNRLAHSQAAGVTATIGATWGASAAFSLTHNPVDGAGPATTYTVAWIGAS